MGNCPVGTVASPPAAGYFLQDQEQISVGEASHDQFHQLILKFSCILFGLGN